MTIARAHTGWGSWLHFLTDWGVRRRGKMARLLSRQRRGGAAAARSGAGAKRRHMQGAVGAVGVEACGMSEGPGYACCSCWSVTAAMVVVGLSPSEGIEALM
jgi:hypothetical protein